jgi:DNA-nicking Smr family endonuclease
MARGGKEKRERPFNAPFRDLGKRIGRRQERGAAALPKRSTSAHSEDDRTLFEREMAGVTPISGRGRKRVSRPGTVPLPPPMDPDAEAYAALADLVLGNGRFDIADTDEYVEGHVAGLDRRVLRRLRRGEFSTQAELDLHGMTREEARAAVERFVIGAVTSGLRCVRIVHGRGLHSRDQGPVLKEKVRAWLSRGRIGRSVLAFTSAQSGDGGTGALYVLLRRARRP